MSRDDGGQAFPHGNPTHGGDIGMTLRDYFAGQVAIGAIREDFSDIALAGKWIYKLADAMIEARSATTEEGEGHE